MEFKILGHLQVSADGQPLALGPRKQRLLLAFLLCRNGNVVSTEKLVDALWGTVVPPSAVSNVHLYVHRLRRALGRERIVGPDRRGYCLVTSADEVDVSRFLYLGTCGQARLAAGDAAGASRHLREALALWRGEPFADLEGEAALREETTRLQGQYVAFLEQRIDADLRLGLHTTLIPELSTLARRFPYREHFTEQLMLALYRAGRQAEALEAYRHLRTVLDRELGLEPGLKLRTLERAILRADRSLDIAGCGLISSIDQPRVSASEAQPLDRTPAQLPPRLADFTGRNRELRRLVELSKGRGLVITSIVGTAGVGKTALAVEWGHRIAGAFPDGQLYVNLRGYDRGQPVPPLQALAGFVRSLGVPPETIPADLDEAVGLYRSLLAGKRALVVLDNAASAEQVRPLLPGHAGCRVVVTSRDRLAGLVARDGARCLELDVMEPGEAVALLSRIVGRDRVEGEPHAAAALARACGQLPLALRIAAANLADQPQQTIQNYAAELTTGSRLAALEIDGDMDAAVRGAFDLSYQTLAEDTKRAFRLLSLATGPSFTREAAAALLGISRADSQRMISRLASAHLLERCRTGRYTFHDLFREYARERVEAEETLTDREAAIHRLYAYYLQQTRLAAERLHPTMLRLPHPHASGEGFPDHAAALSWLDSEQPNLVAAVVHAASMDQPEVAWRLADALRGYFWIRRNTVDWPIAAQAALAAADRSGDLYARASARFSVGVAHMCAGHYRQAIVLYEAALDLCRLAGWTEGQAAALANLGNLRHELGDLQQASLDFREALIAYRELGLFANVALHTGSLGLILLKRGDLPQAVDILVEALALFDQSGSLANKAITMVNLADTYRQLDRHADASRIAGEALTLSRHAGRPELEAAALSHLASVLCDCGRADQALLLAVAAYDLASRTGDRGLQAEVLNAVGSARLQLGNTELAIEHFIQAREIAREPGSRYPEADARIRLAAAHLSVRNTPDALESATRALAIAADDGYRVLEARASSVIAEIYLAAGDPVGAAEHARRACLLHHETGQSAGEARALGLLDRCGVMMRLMLQGSI